MKKQLLMGTLATAMTMGAMVPAMAEDLGNGLEGSMNVTLTTDYVWRGISQSGGHMAIQGGGDVAHSSGFYAGVWASSVDFESDANSEWDFYYGYGTEIGGVSLDVGYVAYTYPDERDLNFEEIYANIGFMGVTLGLAGSGSIVGEDSTSYISLGYETELQGFGLSASIGNYDFKDVTVGNARDYDNYLLSISKSYAGADWALTYTNTDLSSTDCAAFAGRSGYCDSTIALSVSKSL